ncbi:MAG TPA: hypothetical protein VMH20_06835 [Verrucomicrobiae bacterium]|nr:hypothetical protein [Verrucomicrobiae bacterium]
MRNRQTSGAPKGEAQIRKPTFSNPTGASEWKSLKLWLGLPFGLAPVAAHLGSVWDTRATDAATGVFLLSMATVVFWLTTRIGKGLRHRSVFVVMGFVYAGCGLARLAILFGGADNWPKWFGSSVLVFLPLGLLVLALFMFSSIPPLLQVLRASDEVQSLRGQAKLPRWCRPHQWRLWARTVKAGSPRGIQPQNRFSAIRKRRSWGPWE